MPYAPQIQYRGDQALFEGGVNSGRNALALLDYFTKQGERKQEELKLSKAADTFFKTESGGAMLKQAGIQPEDFATRSAADKIGIFNGVQQSVAMRGIQQKLEQGVQEFLLRKQEMDANTAFDTAQGNAVGKTLVTALSQGQGPIKPQPVALEDLVQQIAQTPGAARTPAGSRLLEQALTERGKTERAGAPLVLPPNARATGFNVGPGGVTQQFTVDPERAGQKPEQIFLKDGTPTQKAMYPDGTVIDLPTDRAKALTDAQANALQFSERMAFNNNVLSKLEAAGFDATGAGAAMQKWTPNVMTGENFQQYDAARKNWSAAVLRKESGAAISKSEEKGALEQYFPAFGDAPAVVKQKAELRALAETNMRRAIGGIENQAGAAASSGPAKRYDSEAAARSGGAKAGDVIELYDPGTATYRKARLK